MARPSPLSRPGPAVSLGLGTFTVTIGDLFDVDLTGLADGDVIIWDAGTETWIVGPGGGGSGVTVTDGTTTVNPTTTVDFDPVYFDVTSPGGGVAEVTLLPDGIQAAGRWELAVIPGSPPDSLYADGDWLYIWVGA